MMVTPVIRDVKRNNLLVAVDPDSASFKCVTNADGGIQVLGVDSGGQAVRGVVA